MKNYYVYGYSDPTSTDDYFYIGKGKGNRAYQHINKCKLKQKTHFYKRLKYLLDNNIIPEIQILSNELTNKEANGLEIELIFKYGRLDLGTGCLCNHTNGGEGSEGYYHSEESKRKISESHIENGTNIGNKHCLGFRHTTETRRKVALGQLNLSQEQKDNKIFANRRERGVSICCYSLVTFELIQIFECMSDVNKFGYYYQGVRSVLLGKSTHSGGVGWKYIIQEEIDNHEILKENLLKEKAKYSVIKRYPILSKKQKQEIKFRKMLGWTINMLAKEYKVSSHIIQNTLRK